MDTQGFTTVKSKSQRRYQRKQQRAAAAGWANEEVKPADDDAGEEDPWAGADAWEPPPLDDAAALAAWTAPLTDLTLGDRITEFIPYWLDGVAAALNGEAVPTTEAFFERIHAERDEWNDNPSGWGYVEPGPWGWGPGCG